MSEPGEGPVIAHEAKARVKAWKDKPEHKGKPDQIERTRNDRLDDPKHNKED